MQEFGRPVTADVKYWSDPERLDYFEEHTLRADGDRLRTLWQDTWMFGDDEPVPFPLYVVVNRGTRCQALLRRLDAIGVPYHLDYHPDWPDDDTGQILAPLWGTRVKAMPGYEDGMGFMSDDELNTFFSLFNRRYGRDHSHAMP